ncbi:MAG: NADH:quinone oxidoreductase, partial [Betaproteobacteria bacterium]|nr:NADH:quinone oxidoreductase [Betaproteobacteria bacterium]
MNNVFFWQESVAFPLLAALVLVPLAAMIVVLLVRSSIGIAMGVGFAGALVDLFLSFYLLSVFDPEAGGIQLAEQARF